MRQISASLGGVTEAFTAMVATAEQSFAERVREAEAQQKKSEGPR